MMYNLPQNISTTFFECTLAAEVFLLPVCKQFLEQLLRVDSLDPRVQQGLEAIFVIFVCAWEPKVRTTVCFFFGQKRGFC